MRPGRFVAQCLRLPEPDRADGSRPPEGRESDPQRDREQLAFARALLADPRILILDEATSSVDTASERIIQGAMDTLMAGRTSFVIAHRLSTIRDSHNIMVLNGGEIVEFGPHDELMEQKGFYYALYMSQFKGKAPGSEDASAIEFIST